METVDTSERGIGTFTCTSGVLRVTDPCYSKGTWCAGTVPDCREGEWLATVRLMDCGSWGKRISRLTVVHEDGGTGADESVDFEVGVDSGQAGVFDESRYPNDPNVATSFYDKVCKLTLSKAKAGVVKFGAVSSSGVGDGSYEATVRRDRNGKCFYISIEFLSDDDAW